MEGDRGYPTGAAARRVLEEHVFDAWFPACVDPEGGFAQEIYGTWRRGTPGPWFLEFQARQLRVAALGARLHPDVRAWRSHVEHGYRFLAERLWDRAEGGWAETGDRPDFPRRSYDCSVS